MARVTAGLLWAAGPFSLTRLGVGHLNLLWVVAVLPWVLPTLARPSVDLRRTFLGSLALAVGGPAAGTLGLVVVAVALAVEGTGRRLGRVVAVVGAASASSSKGRGRRRLRIEGWSGGWRGRES